MKQPTPSQVKTAYRRAIAKQFNLKQKDIKCDIHLGSEAPGQWSPNSVLEIYCENYIPNATDYFDPGWHGFAGATVFNAEDWCRIDENVNQALFEKFGAGVRKYHHEPYNNAVISVFEDYY